MRDENREDKATRGWQIEPNCSCGYAALFVNQLFNFKIILDLERASGKEYFVN